MLFKLDFYQAFLDKCEALRAAGKMVIFCGDVNTADREIDLAWPKENQTTTGFLPEEREWMDRFVAAGYADTFRLHYPDLADQYTWWDQVDMLPVTATWAGASTTSSSWPRRLIGSRTPSSCLM